MPARSANFTSLNLLFVLCLAASNCNAQPSRESMVDLGGYRIHVSESGSAAPTVVFESGLGEDVATWNDVAPQVARFAKTFVYDRPGLGKSDPSPHPRTIEQMAAELRLLLQAAKVPPPFVLVGHSLGGPIVLAFAHTYPTEVAALVLVDPESGQLDELLRSRMTPADWAAHQKAVQDALPGMPPPVRAEMKAYYDSSRSVDESFPLPGVPVILLTGTKKNPEFPGNPLEQDLKLQLHNELLAKIPGGKHVLVPNSRHYIQNDAPNIVIDAVREVLSPNPAITPAQKK